MSLPLPGSAQSPSQARDPIYGIIEQLRELSARYDAAVSVSGALQEVPKFDAAEEVTAAACTDLLDFADSLVCSQPTTLAGLIVLLRHVAAMQEWEIPRDLEVSGEDGELTDWTRTFLAKVARALEQIGGAMA